MCYLSHRLICYLKSPPMGEMNEAFPQAGKVAVTVQLQSSLYRALPSLLLKSGNHIFPSNSSFYTRQHQMFHQEFTAFPCRASSVEDVRAVSVLPPAAWKSYKGQLWRVPTDQGESSYLHMILLTLILLLQSAHFPTTHHIILPASHPISIYHLSVLLHLILIFSLSFLNLYLNHVVAFKLQFIYISLTFLPALKTCTFHPTGDAGFHQVLLAEALFGS